MKDTLLTSFGGYILSPLLIFLSPGQQATSQKPLTAYQHTTTIQALLKPTKTQKPKPKVVKPVPPPPAPAPVPPPAPAPPPPPPAPLTFPVAPFGTYANLYDFGNCTWYVASRKPVPNTWGNANTWADGARAAGITVSSVPVVGAIAQTSAGWAGHVAIVVGVGDGTVTVAEMNVLGLDVVDTNTYSASTFVYIYM